MASGVAWPASAGGASAGASPGGSGAGSVEVGEADQDLLVVQVDLAREEPDEAAAGVAHEEAEVVEGVVRQRELPVLQLGAEVGEVGPELVELPVGLVQEGDVGPLLGGAGDPGGLAALGPELPGEGAGGRLEGARAVGAGADGDAGRGGGLVDVELEHADPVGADEEGRRDAHGASAGLPQHELDLDAEELQRSPAGGLDLAPDGGQVLLRVPRRDPRREGVREGGASEDGVVCPLVEARADSGDGVEAGLGGRGGGGGEEGDDGEEHSGRGEARGGGGAGTGSRHRRILPEPAPHSSRRLERAPGVIGGARDRAPNPATSPMSAISVTRRVTQPGYIADVGQFGDPPGHPTRLHRRCRPVR